MKTNEEQLFYACTSFCNTFFHLKCEEGKLRTYAHLGYETPEERKKIMDFHRKHLRHDFERLKELVDKIDGCD